MVTHADLMNSPVTLPMPYPGTEILYGRHLHGDALQLHPKRCNGILMTTGE